MFSVVWAWEIGADRSNQVDLASGRLAPLAADTSRRQVELPHAGSDRRRWSVVSPVPAPDRSRVGERPQSACGAIPAGRKALDHQLPRGILLPEIKGCCGAARILREQPRSLAPPAAGQSRLASRPGQGQQPLARHCSQRHTGQGAFTPAH